MNELTLPFWAGWTVLVTNPYQSPAIGMLQYALLAGLALIIGRLILAAVAAGRRLDRLRPLPPGELTDFPTLLAAKQSGLRVLAAPAGSALIAAIGLVRPALVLDLSVLAQLEQAEQAAVIEHELAHVRRRDSLRIGLTAGCVTMLSLLLVTSGVLYSAFLVRDFTMDRIIALGLCATGLIAGVALCLALERRFAVGCELACDRIAGARTSGETLASAILKLARVAPAATHRLPVLNILGATILRRRIKGALACRSRSRALSAAGPAVLAAATIWMAAHAAATLQDLRRGYIAPNCFACCLIAGEIRRGNLR